MKIKLCKKDNVTGHEWFVWYPIFLRDRETNECWFVWLETVTRWKFQGKWFFKL